MALSDHTTRKARGNRQTIQAAIATAATVYVGSVVCRINSTGRLTPTKGTSREIAGVVISLDKSGANGAGSGVGNTGGTEYATVAYLDEHKVTVATAIRTNTSLGLNVFFSDDDTVAGTAVGTAGVQITVGELVAWAASDKSAGWVAMRRFAPSNIAV